jgi:hypothetical protein
MRRNAAGALTARATGRVKARLPLSAALVLVLIQHANAAITRIDSDLVQ